MMLIDIKRIPQRYLAMAICTMLCACGEAASPKSESVKSSDSDEPMSLALVGYNYTNRYVDSFSVDGQGGGNLYISSPTGGGGGTVCCVRYWPRTKNYTVKVRWQSGGCYFKEKASDSDRIYDSLHSFYEEMEVPVAEDIGDRLEYMEVHFYPDGSVQVAVTGETSMPRLSLSKAREDKSRYPRCPNDQQPFT